MKRIPKNRSESGMTLIELLIAIAISGIILAGVTQILTASTSSYSLQEEMAVVQQNVRMAKMFLERDSRMAGSGLRGNNLYPVEFTDAGGESGTDILKITYIDSDPVCDNILPQLTLSGTMPPTSSEADVDEDLSVPPYSKWANDFTCNGKTYSTSGTNAFKAIITSPDGKSDIVYITQVQANPDKLQNRPYFGIDNKLLNTYPPGSTINFLSEDSLIEIEYRYKFKIPNSDGTLIDCSEAASKTNINCKGTLMRKVTADAKGTPTIVSNDAIADNLEDLQFAIGLDTNDNGDVDKWIADGSSGDNVLDDAEKPQVRLIRINVLGRTIRQHYGQANARPKIEDHAAGASDKFGRQLTQVTVMPRNIKNN